MSTGTGVKRHLNTDSKKHQLPCSHPKRFQNGSVIGMNPRAKIPFQDESDGVAPTEEKHSEAENQLKDMVRKQLDTNVTLQSELSKKGKEFAVGAIFKDDQEQRAGAKALSDFKTLSRQEIEVNDLRNYGLNDEEILLKMKQSGKHHFPSLQKKLLRFGQSTEAKERQIADIELRIESRDLSIVRPDSFTSVKPLTRREMEIEQSLHRGTDKANKFKHLVTMKEKQYHPDDPVIATLKEYEEKTRSKLEKSKKSEYDEESEEDDEIFVGPLLPPLHERITPLDEMEIKRNKLDVNELRLIEKFKNYVPGIPTNILYIKNLAKNVCKEDLAALFIRYENRQNPSMEYRMMQGRMRGQAFVTFPDVESACQALNVANGYDLKGKPIVISFGKGDKR